MKFLLTVMMVLGLAGVARAEDEFGKRFSNESPAALQDYTADPEALADAEALENIAPAAGGDATDDASAANADDNADAAREVEIEADPAP